MKWHWLQVVSIGCAKKIEMGISTIKIILEKIFILHPPEDCC